MVFPKSLAIQYVRQTHVIIYFLIFRCSQIGYDLPDAKSKKYTSMGRGERIDWSKMSKTPAPGQYAQGSDFSAKKPHTSMFTFGQSREAYKKVYLKANPYIDVSLPGPGAYNSERK